MISSLDEEIGRLAILRTKELIAEGFTEGEAVRHSCHGAWAYQEEWVKKVLHEIKRETSAIDIRYLYRTIIFGGS